MSTDSTPRRFRASAAGRYLISDLALILAVELVALASATEAKSSASVKKLTERVAALETSGARRIAP